MAPFEGERRFTSAMTPTSVPRSAAASDGAGGRGSPRGAPARPPLRQARPRVPRPPRQIVPRVPAGGVQRRNACTSGPIRISYSGVVRGSAQPPAARAVAIANFRRSRHAAHEAPTRDSKLSDALLGAKRLRAELRGDRRELQLQLAGDGARAPEQPRAQGLHQALVQREPRDRDPAERARCREAIELPLLGAVAAGVPIEAIAHQRDDRGARIRSCSAAAITTCCGCAATR